MPRRRKASSFITDEEVLDIAYKYGIRIRPTSQRRDSNWVDDMVAAAVEISTLVSSRRRATLPYPAPGQQWIDAGGVTHTVIEVTTEPAKSDDIDFPVVVIYRTPAGAKFPRTLAHWYATMTPVGGTTPHSP